MESIAPNGNPMEEPGKEPVEVRSEMERKVRIFGILLAVLLVVGISEGFYAWWLSHKLRTVEQAFQGQLSAHEENIAELRDRLNIAEEDASVLRGEVGSTRDRLGAAQGELYRTRQMAAQLAEKQKQSTEVLSSQLGALQQEQEATKGTVGSISTDVSGVRQEVTTTRKELASTRSELQRVIGDLGVQSDLIAHNAGELAELRLLGTRDYHEFDLRKAKQPQRIGDIAILLRKTDVKRQKFTLDLVADDRTIEKKDKTANEPVQFYRDGMRLPAEIVVNHVYKDRIVGYVSTPKKKETRLSAVGQSAGASQSGS
jgi:septal ring factor EnvC (AmiA/AmiB activator)